MTDSCWIEWLFRGRMRETEFVFSFDAPTGCAQNVILEWLTLNPAGICGPLCNIFLILIAIFFNMVLEDACTSHHECTCIGVG